MSPDGGLLLQLLPLFQRARRLSRRALLGAVGPATAAGWMATGCRGAKDASAPPAASPPSSPTTPPPRAAAPETPRGLVLSLEAWTALAAATARILPSDDGAGAREANVVAFIDGQLATPLLQPLASAIVLLAELLDKVATVRHGRRFAQLAVADQDTVLSEMARGQLPAPRFPQREAFQALHTLTLEGFLADPVHGGNRAMVGWHLVGFQEHDAGHHPR